MSTNDTPRTFVLAPTLRDGRHWCQLNGIKSNLIITRPDSLRGWRINDEDRVIIVPCGPEVMDAVSIATCTCKVPPILEIGWW